MCYEIQSSFIGKLKNTLERVESETKEFDRRLNMEFFPVFKVRQKYILNIFVSLLHLKIFHIPNRPIFLRHGTLEIWNKKLIF